MLEELLIKRVLEGEPEQFAQLVTEHQHRVFNTAMGLLHNHSDAEDITQDVFLEAFRSLASFRNNSSFATWLYRITINKSLNLLKKKKRSWVVQSIDGLFQGNQNPTDLLQDYSPNAQENMEEEQQVKILQVTLGKLPDNQRVAFTLSKYDELSYAEIAEVMKLSVSAVESLIFRARKKIITTIEKIS
ncbi:MAG TPA: sigma-70 family RNA polymerase sigma factor [Williamwhitmania sp.]|nr:sigma-70 family RNA polymerase sigma factor [Williamwhitmania sp.]